MAKSFPPRSGFVQQPEEAKGWYRRDDNALYRHGEREELQQGVYILQPRRTGSHFEEFQTWHSEVEVPLGQALRLAVDRMGLSEADRLKYVGSATEQEIDAGALSIPDASEHVFAFFRELRTKENAALASGLNGLPEDEALGSFLDLKEQNGVQVLDTEARDLLHSLKTRLIDKLRRDAPGREDKVGNVFTYRSRWTGHAPSSHHLQELCDDVYRSLAEVIQRQAERLAETTPREFETQEQHAFGQERARFFTGREKALTRIADYLQADRRSPLVLHGPSGSGKSASIARAEQLSRRDNHAAHHVTRFVGATPESSNARILLEGLCQQISELYGADTSGIPSDHGALCSEFQERLTLASAESPLFLFLDAIDQLLDEDGVQSLIWLPHELPEGVRMVISMEGEEYERSLANAIGTELPLDPMTPAEGSQLIELWLSNARRVLQEPQWSQVIHLFELCPLPLYLKLAFEEARLWRSYDGVPCLGTDILGIVGNLLDRLAQPTNHGPLLVECAFSYIHCARNGLSEEELLEILARDEDYWSHFLRHAKHELPDAGSRRDDESVSQHILPVVIWSRLHHDMAPYMTERAADGTSLICFYHRQFGEAVERRLLSTHEDQRRRRSLLGRYFEQLPTWTTTKEREAPNQRKVSELAYQQVHAGLWGALESAMTDLSLLEAYSRSGRVFELVRDMRQAVNALPTERPMRRILELLEEAIRREIHFIDRHATDYPQALFQCVWNSGWWYDCPIASAFLEKEADHQQSDDSGPRLYSLLETWREQRKERDTGFEWLRSLLPPSVPLGSAQSQLILRGHEADVEEVSWSPNDDRLATRSEDGKVRIWDAEDGRLRQVWRYSSPEQPVYGVRGTFCHCREMSWSCDGRFIALAYDYEFQVWNTETGAKLVWLEQQQSYEPIIHFSWSPSGQRFVCSYRDRSQVYDLERESVTVAVRHIDYCAVDWSFDGSLVAVIGPSRSIVVYSAEAGQILHTVPKHRVDDQFPWCPTHNLLPVVSKRRRIHIWDADSQREVSTFRTQDLRDYHLIPSCNASEGLSPEKLFPYRSELRIVPICTYYFLALTYCEA